MRKLRLRDSAPQLVGIKPKIEKREKSRERKAESAARLELTIQKELLERLKTGIYGDIYNFNENAFNKILEDQEVEDEDEDEEDSESDREFVEGDFTSDEEDMEEIEYDLNDEDEEEEEEYDLDDNQGK